MYFHVGPKSDFEKSYIESVGRSLCIAQNFECNCRSLAILLDLRSTRSATIDRIDFNEIIEKLSKRMLGGAIQQLALHFPLPATIMNLLEEARNARNYIAHDSLKTVIDSYQVEERLVEYLVELRDAVITIAKADEIVVAWSVGILEGQLVNRSGYVHDVEKWVFEKFSHEDFEIVK